MDPTYLTALAALVGSATGGLTSLWASRVTQQVQISARHQAHDFARRGELYRDFIEEATKSFAHAYENEMLDASSLVRLYALVSQMRMLSSQAVIEQADRIMRMIIETYRNPNKSIQKILANGLSSDVLSNNELDPLCDFSNACRYELKMQLVDRGQRQ